MADDTAGQQARGLPAHLRDDLKWKPGQSGNPAGRPKGARSILQEDFFKALQRKFEENGEAVLNEMIRDKPADFAKMIAGLMSKEITGEDGAPLFPERIESVIVDPTNRGS
jgi:hypothetical protein